MKASNNKNLFKSYCGFYAFFWFIKMKGLEMVKCKSLRINVFRITHTGKISKFSRNKTFFVNRHCQYFLCGFINKQPLLHHKFNFELCVNLNWRWRLKNVVSSFNWSRRCLFLCWIINKYHSWLRYCVSK